MTHAELAKLIASMGGDVRSVLDIGALRRKGYSDTAIMRGYIVPPVYDNCTTQQPIGMPCIDSRSMPAIA
jgi:hypothetical protein